MKLLLTGGYGYLGGRLSKFLTGHSGYDVYIGSSKKQTTSPIWAPLAKPVHTDWDSSAKLEEICAGIDVVVHLAGMNAQDSAADPVASLKFNAVNTGRLLQAAIRQSVRRFIYLSTAHVYGSPLKGLITEEVCPVNLHPYATSHRAGEDMVRAAHQRGDIEGVVIRLSNSFGAPAHLDVNCWMLLVNDLCRQAVSTQQMVLQTSGKQRRDFITLTDFSRAIKHLLELPPEKLGDGLYNVGGAWSPSVFEMTQRVAERVRVITGSKPSIIRNEDRDVGEHVTLDYRIGKLIGTGFKLSENESIDQEIDGLVQFCLGR